MQLIIYFVQHIQSSRYRQEKKKRHHLFIGKYYNKKSKGNILAKHNDYIIMLLVDVQQCVTTYCLIPILYSIKMHASTYRTKINEKQI